MWHNRGLRSQPALFAVPLNLISESSMINDVKKTTESIMNKTLEAFKTDLS